MLRVVGGAIFPNKSITMLMVDGYDILPPRWEKQAMRLLDQPNGLYLIDGDEANPFFSWPVYALLEDL